MGDWQSCLEFWSELIHRYAIKLQKSTRDDMKQTVKNHQPSILEASETEKWHYRSILWWSIAEHAK